MSCIRERNVGTKGKLIIAIIVLVIAGLFAYEAFMVVISPRM